jgi:hypothetical protein
MKLELDLTEAEMVLVASAADLHREHLEGDLERWKDWIKVQADVERKLLDAGLAAIGPWVRSERHHA